MRALLDLGADPNDASDASLPPLIAAIGCTREAPGAPARTDVDQLVRLLLRAGADPNQRGINDYTALHMAAAEGNALVVERLLEAGADADLRTRVDECETPLELAAQAGLTDIAARLERRGVPLRTRLRSGITLLFDVPGTGVTVQRQHRYIARQRCWLAGGSLIRWPHPSGPVGIAQLEDDGETLFTEITINRGRLVSGVFYGVEGMRVGGTRRLELAPYVAYAERGVPGLIPPHATLVVEITVVEACAD